MERLILLTGKGGVGKTSLAAAHAVASADSGRRTLLMSMDAAHNLADLFEVPPAPAPREVVANLDLLEVDPNTVRDHDFPDITRALAELVVPDARRQQDAEVLDVPGLDPLFFLLKLQEMAASGRYDRIIGDLAPTGETLTLLQLPDLLEWWMERLFPLQRVAARVLSPVSQRLWHVKLPDRRAMNDIEALYQRLHAIGTLLRDPATASVRLVTQPERMVVEETKRSAMYLGLYGYAVDHVFVNGVYPADEVGPFFSEWLAVQAEHLAEIDAAFGHLPVTRIQRFPTDIAGVGGVRALAGVALDDHAFDVLDIPRESYAKTSTGYTLTLPVPLASKDALDVHLTEADLVVRIGNFQRNLPLPDSLHGCDITSARYRDDRLTVDFQHTPKEN